MIFTKIHFHLEWRVIVVWESHGSVFLFHRVTGGFFFPGKKLTLPGKRFFHSPGKNSGVPGEEIDGISSNILVFCWEMVA